MDFGLRFDKTNRTEVRNCFGFSKPNRYRGIPKTFFFFTCKRKDDARGGASTVGEEEMEDHVEMEQDSHSNVTMLAALLWARKPLRLLKVGIPRDTTVLMRTCPRTSYIDTFRIMGWSVPNGPKILCGASSRNSVPRISRVQKTTSNCLRNPPLHDLSDGQDATCVLHSEIGQRQFTVEPRVCALIGNSSLGEKTEQNHATPNATPNAGNGAGAVRHEVSMLRHCALQTLFVHDAVEQAGASGKQRSVTDMFKPSSV
jgi:hypothetical protein